MSPQSRIRGVRILRRQAIDLTLWFEKLDSQNGDNRLSPEAIGGSLFGGHVKWRE
tara:strand:+ start:493 stop:657 length:165 start_codon:yes stop_codon:yes gene_type:complete